MSAVRTSMASSMKLFTPVTVTVCGMFQFAVVKVRVGRFTSTTPDEGLMLIVALRPVCGDVLSTTV